MIKVVWGICYRHSMSIIGHSLNLMHQLSASFQVFCLASSLNSKLSLAHSTKYSTSSNCNSMQISRKSYVQFSKYTQLNF